MKIEIKHNIIGSILDIGGGGEGVIARLYGDSVIAIDNCQEELDEVPSCCNKQLMDATELLFAPESFDNVTFFYSLMYMAEDIQRKAINEAARVLKPGGNIIIWDCEIDSAYPEAFVVDLEIRSGNTAINTYYGIIKNEKQDLDSIIKLLQNAEVNVESIQKENGQFYINCRK